MLAVLILKRAESMDEFKPNPADTRPGSKCWAKARQGEGSWLKAYFEKWVESGSGGSMRVLIVWASDGTVEMVQLGHVSFSPKCPTSNM